MCFITKFLPCQHIAKKDIIVYKIIYDDNISLCKCFQYIKDKLNELVEIRFEAVYRYIAADEGYYSYKIMKTVLNEISSSKMNIKSFNNGFIKISKFAIPKGTKYYINEDNIIISENIIYKSDISLTRIKLFHYGMYRKIKCNRRSF